MNITGALMLFSVFALIYLLIIEIFTILFRLTGLTYDKAHFQVISMLTNSGFTTGDSEAITASKVRRKIAKLTIIFGYLFTVIIMSCVVNIFLSLSNSEIRDMWASTIILGCFIGLFLMVNRSKTVKKFIDLGIEKVGKKIMFGKNSNSIVLLDIYGESVMAEINLVNLPNQLKDVKLKDSKLKEFHKIQLILIKREGETKSIINGEDTLHENDIIVVFGKHQNIKMLFGRHKTG